MRNSGPKLYFTTIRMDKIMGILVSELVVKNAENQKNIEIFIESYRTFIDIELEFGTY